MDGQEHAGFFVFGSSCQQHGRNFFGGNSSSPRTADASKRRSYLSWKRNAILKYAWE